MDVHNFQKKAISLDTSFKMYEFNETDVGRMKSVKIIFHESDKEYRIKDIFAASCCGKCNLIIFFFRDKI